MLFQSTLILACAAGSAQTNEAAKDDSVFLQPTKETLTARAVRLWDFENGNYLLFTNPSQALAKARRIAGEDLFTMQSTPLSKQEHESLEMDLASWNKTSETLLSEIEPQGMDVGTPKRIKLCDFALFFLPKLNIQSLEYEKLMLDALSVLPFQDALNGNEEGIPIGKPKSLKIYDYALLWIPALRLKGNSYRELELSTLPSVSPPELLNMEVGIQLGEPEQIKIVNSAMLLIPALERAQFKYKELRLEVGKLTQSLLKYLSKTETKKSSVGSPDKIITHNHGSLFLSLLDLSEATYKELELGPSTGRLTEKIPSIDPESFQLGIQQKIKIRNYNLFLASEAALGSVLCEELILYESEYGIQSLQPLPSKSLSIGNPKALSFYHDAIMFFPKLNIDASNCDQLKIYVSADIESSQYQLLLDKHFFASSKEISHKYTHQYIVAASSTDRSTAELTVKERPQSTAQMIQLEGIDENEKQTQLEFIITKICMAVTEMQSLPSIHAIHELPRGKRETVLCSALEKIPDRSVSISGGRKVYLIDNDLLFASKLNFQGEGYDKLFLETEKESILQEIQAIDDESVLIGNPGEIKAVDYAVLFLRKLKIEQRSIYSLLVLSVKESSMCDVLTRAMSLSLKKQNSKDGQKNEETKINVGMPREILLYESAWRIQDKIDIKRKYILERYSLDSNSVEEIIESKENSRLLNRIVIVDGSKESKMPEEKYEEMKGRKNGFIY